MSTDRGRSSHLAAQTGHGVSLQAFQRVFQHRTVLPFFPHPREKRKFRGPAQPEGADGRVSVCLSDKDSEVRASGRKEERAALPVLSWTTSYRAQEADRGVDQRRPFCGSGVLCDPALTLVLLTRTTETST